MDVLQGRSLCVSEYNGAEAAIVRVGMYGFTIVPPSNTLLISYRHNLRDGDESWTSPAYATFDNVSPSNGAP